MANQLGSDISVLRDLVAEALDVPPESRLRFVRRRTVGNPDLECHALRLLAAAEQVADDLEMPVGQTAEQLVSGAFGLPDLENAEEGRRVGAYRLLRKIGEGGMGSVFLAERVDGAFERKVAVKFVRDSASSAAVLDRFRTEEQILARLVHPGIARIYDGGVSDDGVPYFAMEYVDGLPVTDYCRQQSLTIEERLRLFVGICEAVQYAHQILVVHRDIKPQNILVTTQGRVKLLDFGIAKVLNLDSQQTATYTGLYTPTYAAPEQINQLPINTAVDVYSLGVVLFELLTGRLPYSTSTDLSTLIREICEVELPPPSSVVTGPDSGDIGAERRRSINKHSRRLRGDLDTIVLKALRKAPEQRYPSVAAFADDVRRHLDGKPIRARRTTAGYRLRKLIGRHPVGSSLLIASLMMILAAVMYANMQRLTAQKERDIARTEARVATLVAEQLRYLIGVDTLSAGDRKQHLKSRIDYLLALGDSTQQRLRADVLGNSDVGSREVAGALLSLGEALIVLEEDTLAGLAWSNAQRIGEECCGPSAPLVLEILTQRANHAYCIRIDKDSIWADFVQRTRGRATDTTRWNFWRMWAHMTAGRWAEADRFNDALDEDYFVNVASKAKILGRLNVAHHPAFPRYTPLDQAAEIARHAIDGIPSELFGLSIYPQIAVHTAASIELYRGNFAEAERLIEQYDRVLGTSSLQLFRPQLYGMSASLHGDFAASKGDLDTADSLFTVAVQHSGAQSRGWPVIHLMRQVKLASVLLLRGQYDDVERIVLPILARLEEIRFDTWPVRDLLVRLYAETDRLDEAAVFTEGSDSTDYDVRLRAWVRFLRGDLSGSESLLARTIDQARASNEVVLDSIYHGEMMADLSATRNSMGKPDAALPLAREALYLLDQKLGPEHWKTAYAKSVLGESIARSGREEGSRDLKRRGYATLLSTRGPVAQVTRLARKRLDAPTIRQE